MKKFLSILAAIMMIFTLASTAALAEEDISVPQTEGGKKFDTNWGIRGIFAEIDYEEEGYRVFIETSTPEDLTGYEWEYNCFYNEEKDALVSVSSAHHTYDLDPETLEKTNAHSVYDDIDEEGSETVFTISEEGKLLWNDPHDHSTLDLEFENIGRFNGQYKNDEEQVKVDFKWEGLDEEAFYYTVLIHRGEGESYTEFNMQGLYNTETGKLECKGTATVWNQNADGSYEPTEDPETYDAFFSMNGDGTLLYETANGIHLEPVDSFEDGFQG